ncbi:MAG: hypothetical protein ABIR46_04005 [Candidatus Saccharimonadales bacterium]
MTKIHIYGEMELFSTCTTRKSRTVKEKMMDEGFIVDLPPEANDTRFNVYAPLGGLSDQITKLLEREIFFLDLDIRHGFTTAVFRIYPGDNISRDARNPYRYRVNDGVGVFLDEFGKEHSSNISFGGILEVAARHQGLLTGELTLWKRPLPDVSVAS